MTKQIGFQAGEGGIARMVRNKIRQCIFQKAALAVRATYQGLSMIFVATHLYPHDENAKKRLKNYEQILDDVSFGKEGQILDHE